LSTLYGNPTEGVGLAARVILHLSSLARLGSNDVARLSYTQQGMVAALDVGQGSIVKVLQRLLAGDVVSVERRFVADANRHMKVYRLTPLGESTARNIKRHSTEPLRPKSSSNWVVEGEPDERPRPEGTET
jgi:DNA-binding PadR family transcriptional regulator